MNTEIILKYLEMVANNNLFLNFSMHIVALIALVSIFIVKRENIKRLIFHASVSIMFLSVTINALVFGNPFHAVTFGILALTALAQLFVAKNNIQITSSKWHIAVALFFIFLGLWYPEFVEKNAVMLLMVAPMGVIPCPTLLTTLGLLTLVLPSVSKFQYVITIITGLIYGLIGVFVFNVALDITLLILTLYATYTYFNKKRTITSIVP